MEQHPQWLSQMHSFSVVARTMSFTRAAQELCLTQGAVSHRIHILKQKLGFKLFVRLTRRLELTAEGERLLATLNLALNQITAELEQIRLNELFGELYIGVAPSFAQAWLLPRLPGFQQRYPNLNLRVRVKVSKLDFQHEPVDLAIYYSNTQHAGFNTTRLYEEWLAPVCSPEYAARLDLQQPENLQRAVLIHCTEAIDAISAEHEWAF